VELRERFSAHGIKEQYLFCVIDSKVGPVELSIVSERRIHFRIAAEDRGEYVKLDGGPEFIVHGAFHQVTIDALPRWYCGDWSPLYSSGSHYGSRPEVYEYFKALIEAFADSHPDVMQEAERFSLLNQIAEKDYWAQDHERCKDRLRADITELRAQVAELRTPLSAQLVDEAMRRKATQGELRRLVPNW